jgi:GntR family transcriptional repressor for pyruvate dehydrogenase complex
MSLSGGRMHMKSQPLSSKIAEELAEIIFEGKKYKPGEKLPTERQLSEMLGASRTSIREASKQLEARGILTVKRGVGTFVSENPGVSSNPLGISIQTDDIHDTASVLIDWYRVRRILEGDAMVMVAENATDEEIAEIEAIMEHENSLVNLSDVDFLSADQQFHCALARATHNIVMERLIPSLHASIYYDMVKSLYGRLCERYKRNAVQNHADIVRYLKLRNGEAAALAMRYHMLVAIDDMFALKNGIV